MLARKAILRLSTRLQTPEQYRRATIPSERDKLPAALTGVVPFSVPRLMEHWKCSLCPNLHCSSRGAVEMGSTRQQTFELDDHGWETGVLYCWGGCCFCGERTPFPEQ